MRRLIRRLAATLDRGLDAGWDDYDAPTYAASVDPRTVSELDDAIDHLDGARAALRDIRARLAEPEMVPDNDPGVTA